MQTAYTANVWRMTVPTLPRRWGEILALAGLTFGLTATLVTGAGPEQCGTNSLCGYGARCDTTQCVCLSDNDDLRKRDDNPFSTFYCLGDGVTECGDQLCGYRAECNTDRSGCRCSFNNAERRELKGTSPSLLYCVEKCELRGSMCPDNTTCTDYSGHNKTLCQCSEEATLSSTGQCLGKPSKVHVTTEGDSPTQNKATRSTRPTSTIRAADEASAPKDDNSRELTVGLAAGMGGAILLAVVFMIFVYVWKHCRLKEEKRGGSQSSALQDTNSTDIASTVELGHSYENVVSSSLPGESGPSNAAGPILDLPSVVPAYNSPNTYENINAPSQLPNGNDNSRLYQSVNTADTSETRLYTTLRQNLRSH